MTKECRCDCISCVTGNHHQCYYNPPLYADCVHTCPIKLAWDEPLQSDKAD